MCVRVCVELRIKSEIGRERRNEYGEKTLRVCVHVCVCAFLWVSWWVCVYVYASNDAGTSIFFFWQVQKTSCNIYIVIEIYHPMISSIKDY